MTELKNMKFKVDSPEQSERVINVLQRMGYRLFGNLDIRYFIDCPFLYSYADGDIASGQECAHVLSHQLQNTAAFLAAHEPAPAPTTEKVVAHPDGGWSPPEGSWFDNTGAMPDLPEGTRLDVKYNSGLAETEGFPPEFWSWRNDGLGGQISQWRYHSSSEPSEYFVQPKTEPKYPEGQFIEVPETDNKDTATGREVKPDYSPTNLVAYTADGKTLWKYQGGIFVDISSEKELGRNEASDRIFAGIHANKESFTAEAAHKAFAGLERRTIDSHYNFSYTLTEADKLAGTIKIDPYFVSQQWNLGSKDSTGVVFHLLKTLARFGDKNSKEREINALHKSIIRLAQLEGVTLK